MRRSIIRVLLTMCMFALNSISHADGNINYREYDRTILEDSRTVGVYVDFIDEVEVAGEESGNMGAAVGAGVLTALGGGVLDAVILGAVLSGGSQLRADETSNGNGFPPEGSYQFARLSIFGDDIDWDKEWERIVQRTIDLVQKNERLNIAYTMKQRGGRWSKITSTDINRIIDYHKKEPPRLALKFTHSIRLSSDKSKIWYVVDMAAYDVPGFKHTYGKAKLEFGESVESLGVTRFAAAHDIGKPFRNDGSGPANKEFMRILSLLKDDVFRMLAEYLSADKPLNGTTNELVLAKYGDLLERQKQNLRRELSKFQSGKEDPSGKKKVYVSKRDIAAFRRLKNILSKLENFNETEKEKYMEVLGSEWEQVFLKVGETDTRLELFNITGNDYFTIPKEMSGIILEDISISSAAELDKKSERHPEMLYMTSGIARMEYSLLFSSDDHLEVIYKFLQEQGFVSRSMARACAARLWAIKDTDKFQTMDVLARLIRLSNDGGFYDFMEKMKNEARSQRLSNVLDKELKHMKKENVVQLDLSNIIPIQNNLDMAGSEENVIKAGLMEGSGRELLYMFKWLARKKEVEQEVLDSIAYALFRRYRTSDESATNSLGAFARFISANPRYREILRMIAEMEEETELARTITKIYGKMKRKDVEQYIPGQQG